MKIQVIELLTQLKISRKWQYWTEINNFVLGLKIKVFVQMILKYDNKGGKQEFIFTFIVYFPYISLTRLYMTLQNHTGPYMTIKDHTLPYIVYDNT